MRTEHREKHMQVQYTIIDPFLATCLDESCWSVYGLWSMIYALSHFWVSSVCTNPPLVVITRQSIAFTMSRKRSCSQVITPLLAPPVQDEDRHPPSPSLSLVIPYVLLSSRVSRCRASIPWNSSFRLGRRFRRLRRRS